MIRSTTPRVYDALSGASDTIYVYSTIENQIAGDYIIRTFYVRKQTVGGVEEEVRLMAFQDFYTVTEIDAMFEALRSSLGSLPFTQMLRTAIELSLLNFLNTHEKFGIAPNSGGWEIE